jgi:hypothetical protein
MADKYRIDVMSAFNEKGMPLDAWHDFITGPHDDNQETLINIDKAYRSVPWLYRGVNLRADAVSNVPWHFETMAGADVTESPDWEYLAVKMRRLLAVTEKSLTKRGCAYWLIETNRMDKKPTPRYIPSQGVRPIKDAQQGIVGYEITWSSGTRRYPLDQVVHFVLENDDSEIEPDVAPAQVALEAAGLLYASNAAPARFYSGGFVPVSLIAVPLTTQKEDISKLEAFFRRAGTGLKNMFNVLGVYEGVKVETVGHTLKDSITPDITSAARDDVAVALVGVPTMLDATSANYATASSETVNFILNIVFSECDTIQDIANEQFFNPLGIRFVFDKSEHEIMQTVQLTQAQGVVTLTGKPPLTVDEGREMLGYEAGEGPEEVEPVTVDETATPEYEAASDADLVKALIDEMQASRKVLENGNGQH